MTVSRDLVLAHIDSPVRVTADRARAVLELLDRVDESTARPRLLIAIDGELTLMWTEGDKTLALIPQPDGVLRFCAEFGREIREGAVTGFPPVVQKLIESFGPDLH